MNAKNLVTVDKSIFVLIKEMRDEQKKFFKITKEAAAKKLPALWAERKKCLDSCRQLESYLDSHIANILSGEGKEVPHD